MKRFCEVIELSRASFSRRKAGGKGSGTSRRRRPPEAIVALIRETALAYPVGGYRRVRAWLKRQLGEAASSATLPGAGGGIL